MGFKAKDIVYYSLLILIPLGFVAAIVCFLLGLVFIGASLYNALVSITIINIKDISVYVGFVVGGGTVFVAISHGIKSINNPRLKKKLGI